MSVTKAKENLDAAISSLELANNPLSRRIRISLLPSRFDGTDEEMAARIEELIQANTWPNKWRGDELRGDTLIPQIIKEGVVQPLLHPELFSV